MPLHQPSYECITRKVLRRYKFGLISLPFQAYWDHNIQLVRMPDESCTIPDLCGDMFKPECNPVFTAEELKNQERQFKRRIREEGVWGIGLAVGGAPDYETFVWGHVGDDCFDSMHLTDLFNDMGARIK